nr:hypothetical protein [Psychrobacter sp. PraFG1]UNK06160.1 hypothetical protein MN210_05935 [Psychrobacter sp. PraFG1]
MLNPVRASLPIFAKATLALMVAAVSLTGLVGARAAQTQILLKIKKSSH